MTFTEYVKSYFHLLDSPLRYYGVYRNSFSVMINILRKRFPFQGILKNGKKITIHNYYEAYLTSFGIMDGYNIGGNIITISSKRLPKIKLDLENNNGDIHGVFFADAYDFLPVKDKIVLDIGANIGDSAIYFALNGAKKVIALEPFPKNNKTARKNIDSNNLSDRITLLSAGCSGEKGEITLDPNQEGAGSATRSVSFGVKVPLKTINELIEEYSIPEDSIMKIDCEGCEYDVILSSSEKILRKFTHIQVEYHYGYKNLKQKLENSGFFVTTSSPQFLRNRQSNKSMYFGYLYAKRI